MVKDSEFSDRQTCKDFEGKTVTVIYKILFQLLYLCFYIYWRDFYTMFIEYWSIIKRILGTVFVILRFIYISIPNLFRIFICFYLVSGGFLPVPNSFTCTQAPINIHSFIHMFSIMVLKFLLIFTCQTKSSTRVSSEFSVDPNFRTFSIINQYLLDHDNGRVW